MTDDAPDAPDAVDAGRPAPVAPPTPDAPDVTERAADPPAHPPVPGAPAAEGRPDQMGVVLRLPFGRGQAAAPTETLTEPDVADTAEIDAGSPTTAPVDGDRSDWAWVEEWRAGQEPTPWATGLTLVGFSALLVGVAVWVLSAGLADRPVVAILVNLLVAGGLTPAIWLSRGLPVLRWLGAGAALGIVIGWISAVLMLPLPAP